jgi:predicted porin
LIKINYKKEINMKKVAIAAAVAGAFATSATAAELSTFIYQDYALTNIDYSPVSGNTGFNAMEIQSAGSNMVNFNYSDDLGNGLGLIGSFSMVATGSRGSDSTCVECGGVSDITNRNSFIGLTGNFGKITFGTHEFQAELAVILKDGWDANYGVGAGGVLRGIGITDETPASGFVGRRAQGVEWTSANMNGLTIIASHYEGNDATPNAIDQNGQEVNFVYDMGGLKIDGGAGSASDAGGVAGDSSDFSYLGFSYDMGTVSVAGSVFTEKAYDSSSTTNLEQSGRHINVTMPTSGGRIIANMSSQSDRKENNTTQAQSGRSGWDVGYMHDFSANTKGYVRYGVRSVDSDYSSAALTAGDTAKIQLGLRFVY